MPQSRRAEARLKVGPDPRSHRQEIAAVRDRLAVTVDLLAVRANPQRVADDLQARRCVFSGNPAVAATLAGWAW